MENLGFDPEEINKIKQKCQKTGKNFIINDEEPQGDEFVHFYFVGKYEGKEVIFDTALFTLRLYHSSLLYEQAEDAAEKQFPGYKRSTFEEDENGEIILPNEEEENEEIEVFKMEFIEELEENDTVKVQEYVTVDTDFDYGIALEVALNVEEVSENDIADFVTNYNSGNLKLDTTLYSFKTEEEED